MELINFKLYKSLASNLYKFHRFNYMEAIVTTFSSIITDHICVQYTMYYVNHNGFIISLYTNTQFA